MSATIASQMRLIALIANCVAVGAAIGSGDYDWWTAGNAAFAIVFGFIVSKELP